MKSRLWDLEDKCYSYKFRMKRNLLKGKKSPVGLDDTIPQALSTFNFRLDLKEEEVRRKIKHEISR